MGISIMYSKLKKVIAPKPKKILKELNCNGHTRTDFYFWMNKREDPEVIQHLESENAYTRAILSHTEPAQELLFNEIKGRIPQIDQSAPYLKNGYFYFHKFEEGNEYPVYYRYKEDEPLSNARIILDVNELAKGHNYCQVGGLSVSPDNRFLVYGVDYISRRLYTLKMKDLITDATLSMEIKNTTGSVAWANDSKRFVYTEKDQSLRPYRIKLHNTTKKTLEDKIIYEEADDTFICYAKRSNSGKYILIASHQSITSEYRVLDADNPENMPSVFQPRRRGHEYDIDHIGEYFYIRTNIDGENFSIKRCSTTHFEGGKWEDWLACRNDVLIEGFELFEDFIVVCERIQGLTQFEVFRQDQSSFYIKFPEGVYMAFPTQNFNQKTNVLRLAYTSLTTPVSYYNYNMDSQTFELIKQQEVSGGFHAENYHTERLWIPSRDGQTKIPVSIVYNTQYPPSEKTPLLLYGYGSYGYSIDPVFSSARLSLLDRGFTFAIAHIRGGEELGRRWYDQGKLGNKKNTFYDFIDVASWMVSHRKCSSDKLFAYGGSAGGLLVGAVINERPELFTGVIAAVPFVDVVTTMLDDTIPLTTGEYDEWGNPNNPEEYSYMLSYSPYDNVKALPYPALLVTTGYHDSQVQYWEPAKWVAKIRDNNQANTPILLHTNMGTGHSGATGRFETHKETAMEYAFLLDLAGKLPKN